MKTNEALQPIKEQAEKAIEHGKEFIELGRNSKVRAIKKAQFDRKIESLTRNLIHVNRKLASQIKEKRQIVKNRMLRNRRDGINNADDTSELSLFNLLQNCIWRLSKISMNIQCEIIGCDKNGNPLQIPSSYTTHSTRPSTSTPQYEVEYASTQAIQEAEIQANGATTPIQASPDDLASDEENAPEIAGKEEPSTES